MTDTFSDGKTIRLFESGSIMQYLVERYDKDYKVSYPPESRKHFEVNNWVCFRSLSSTSSGCRDFADVSVPGC